MRLTPLELYVARQGVTMNLRACVQWAVLIVAVLSAAAYARSDEHSWTARRSSLR